MFSGISKLISQLTEKETPEDADNIIIGSGFLLTRPSRDVTADIHGIRIGFLVSTHTSLAGRDRYILFQ